MMKKLISALTLWCAATLPFGAQADTTAPIVGEILTGWQQPDGTRIAALRLTLAPGWKTYWRSPGDAGIPPRFDWSRSSNLRNVGITWPTPKVFRQSGMRSIGYDTQVVLPLHISPRAAGKPVELNADLDIGVCSDICVPYQLSLSGTLSGDQSTPTPAIAAALAARPYSAGEAGVTAATCSLRPTQDGMEIQTRLTLPATGGREVVVIEPGPGIWMSETDTSRRGRQLIATGDMATSNGGPVAINRSEIKITVLGKKHAVEIQGCTPG